MFGGGDCDLIGTCAVNRTPLIETSVRPGKPSLMLTMPDWWWASTVSRLAPGPVIVRAEVIFSSPCVRRIDAGPLAVRAAANSMVSAPETVLVAKIASRSEVKPSLKSIVSASVVTVTTASRRRSSSGSYAAHGDVEN